MLTASVAVLLVLLGAAIGLLSNRLAKLRLAEAAPAPRRGGAALGRAALTPAPPWLRPLLVANVVLLAGGGALLYLWLRPQGPFVVSQALLLLYVLYPLALVDGLTLWVEAPLTLTGLVLRLGGLLLWAPAQLGSALNGALAGAGLLYLVDFAYRSVRGRDGLGAGDPAVMALIGAFVGWQGLVPVMAGAAGLGLLAGVPWLLLQRRALNTALPFGPFLCAAGLAVFCLQIAGWLPAAAVPGP